MDNNVNSDFVAFRDRGNVDDAQNQTDGTMSTGHQVRYTRQKGEDATNAVFAALDKLQTAAEYDILHVHDKPSFVGQSYMPTPYAPIQAVDTVVGGAFKKLGEAFEIGFNFFLMSPFSVVFKGAFVVVGTIARVVAAIPAAAVGAVILLALKVGEAVHFLYTSVRDREVNNKLAAEINPLRKEAKELSTFITTAKNQAELQKEGLQNGLTSIEEMGSKDIAAAEAAVDMTGLEGPSRFDNKKQQMQIELGNARTELSDLETQIAALNPEQVDADKASSDRAQTVVLETQAETVQRGIDKLEHQITLLTKADSAVDTISYTQGKTAESLQAVNEALADAIRQPQERLNYLNTEVLTDKGIAERRAAIAGEIVAENYLAAAEKAAAPKGFSFAAAARTFLPSSNILRSKDSESEYIPMTFTPGDTGMYTMMDDDTSSGATGEDTQ